MMIKRTYGTRCEAPDQGAEGDLPGLLARLDRLHLLARERLIRGEAQYRGAWRDKDNLGEAEQEIADCINYLTFALVQAEGVSAKPTSRTPGPQPCLSDCPALPMLTRLKRAESRRIGRATAPPAPAEKPVLRTVPFLEEVSRLQDVHKAAAVFGWTPDRIDMSLRCDPFFAAAVRARLHDSEPKKGKPRAEKRG
jgi:hypothetical protein